MYARFKRRDGCEQGYVLLALLLMIALMGILAATVITSIKFDVRRDREEEMIHRGVQYSRAIRAYYKKFGRYPATLENLENTNQQRFLRKRYKDPLTGKDFKLLHFGEVKLSLNGMGGGVIPGASSIGPNGTLTSNGSSSSFGSNSGFGNSNSFGNASTFGQSAQRNPNNQTTGTDSSQSSGSDTEGNPSQTVTSGGTTDSGDRTSADRPAQSFGGMPIVGVASTSKEQTIRIFDKKKKYNEWQFVYDPTLDRGFLITTPYEPQLQLFGTGPQNVNGPQQNPGLGTSPFGPSGYQNTPNNNTFGNPNQGLGNPNQPTDTPNRQ
ncbi:MAG TPA: hypothetical protein VMU05_22420 [Dongiaceae bacterium]|nr:hypothetical protein [Dongiaceae bacterium]